jgi:hypothetical protein
MEVIVVFPNRRTAAQRMVNEEQMQRSNRCRLKISKRREKAFWKLNPVL